MEDEDIVGIALDIARKPNGDTALRIIVNTSTRRLSIILDTDAMTSLMDQLYEMSVIMHASNILLAYMRTQEEVEPIEAGRRIGVLLGMAKDASQKSKEEHNAN